MGYRKRVLSPQLRCIVWVVVAVAVFGASFLIGNVIRSKRSTDATAVPDGSRIEENSPLTYYLKVKYDGVDRRGVGSSDSVTSEVRSNTIFVTDTIPEKLTFVGFVENGSGSIGAVKRSDGVTACSGSVIDDTSATTGWINNGAEYVWHGLHYIKATRKVTFRVKDLMAGCQLQVGINTRTPFLGVNENRIDYYNTANFLEGDFSGKSNTTHHYIGRDEVAKYQVKYQYTGTIPDGAPAAPETAEYAEGQTVGVAAELELSGYNFSGWTTSDVTVSDNSFSMPTRTVTFTGSFTAKPKYSVIYNVTGAPESYHEPITKQYGAGDYVEVDSLATNAVVDGYRFYGWSTDDVTVSNGGFVMPSENVTINGRFEIIKYTVSYQFTGNAMPANANSLRPVTRSYSPGDDITVASAPTAEGYRFLGWDRDNFKMPEANVVIYGEWAVQNNVFRPNITQRIIDPKDKYYKGERVKFEITITNQNSVQIKNINVGLDLDGAEFKNGTGYTRRTDQLAQIPSLNANQSIKLTAEFEVTDNVTKTWTNLVELLSAEAGDGYDLDISDEAMASYSTTVDFQTESWNDIPVFTGVDLGQSGPFVILTMLGALGGVTVVLRSRREKRI